MKELDQFVASVPEDKHEQKNSVAWKKFGLLFHHNLKLAFRNVASMVLGIIFVLVYGAFTIAGALEPTSALYIIVATRILVGSIFFLIFIALLCGYLFRQQLDDGIHRLERQDGVPAFQIFAARLLIAFIVIATYVSMTVIISFAGLQGPSRHLYVLLQLTPTLAYYFLGLFFLAICATWMVIAKKAGGMAMSLFIGLAMIIAPLCYGAAEYMMFLDGKQPMEDRNVYKQNHVLGASVISEYITKFIDGVNDAGLADEIINDTHFLTSVRNQLRNEEVSDIQWYATKNRNQETSTNSDGTINELFSWLISNGLPLYVAGVTNDEGLPVLIGNDDPSGLGGILSAFNDVALSIPINEKIEDESIKDAIRFFSIEPRINDYIGDDNFETFQTAFTAQIEQLGRAKKFTLPTWNEPKNYAKLKVLATNLIGLIETYQKSWEFPEEIGLMTQGNDVVVPFNVNNRGVSRGNIHQYYAKNQTVLQAAQKIVRYSNEHNEYRAMIAALMTGFQDLRDPLFSVIGDPDRNSNPADATVPLRKFINDDFNDYVHELKISSDFNLLNHFSYIMLGYEPDWILDAKIAKTYATILYQKDLSQYRSVGWIADAFANLTDEELATNDTAVLTKGNSHKKYIWNYGGLIAGYLVVILTVMYLGSLIHKRRSKI
jgi:hypothetical protein